MDLRDILFICIFAITIIIFVFSLTSFRKTFLDRKHGLKHTFTDSSIITEWDFESPMTLLRLLNLFIQSEDDNKQRNKYIRQYKKLKEELKEEKYDVSDFPDYEIHEQE